MKLPLLLVTLLLASSPAFANKAYTAWSFDGESYVLDFYLVDNTDSLYSVSVVEPRSVRRDGYAVPPAFSFDCRKGEGSGYVAMGATDQKPLLKKSLPITSWNSVSVLDIDMKIRWSNKTFRYPIPDVMSLPLPVDIRSIILMSTSHAFDLMKYGADIPLVSHGTFP